MIQLFIAGQHGMRERGDLYFTSENLLIKWWNLLLSIELTVQQTAHNLSLTIIIVTPVHIVMHCSQN